MAITSAIMQMRRGEEEYFDPDKMHPGEWAVSTDTKYVRMCFSHGVCVRMATYEAFEEDMERIIAILNEAITVQEAIEEIYKEFQKAELDIEAAENSAILSESYAHGGTGTREGEDTDNAKYYAELAKKNIEPVMNAVYDIALNRQTLGYTKKNLLKLDSRSGSYNGITHSSDVEKGTITFNGTFNGSAFFIYNSKFYLKAGTYILSGCPAGGNDGQTNYYRQTVRKVYSDGSGSDNNDYGNGNKITVTQEDVDDGVYFNLIIGIFAEFPQNLTFRPMIRSADIEDDTFEPYVDDVKTRLDALTPVNNLLATVEGSPLDAVQGKLLADRILALETAIQELQQ